MEVIYFNTQIKDGLSSLGEPSHAKSSKQIKLLETFGHMLSMPYSKQISKNLFELRIRGQQEIRIFYCFHQNKAVILHYFVKKSQKTPQREIETALKRRLLLT